MVRCKYRGVVWNTCEEGRNKKKKVGVEEKNVVSIYPSWPPSHKKRPSSGPACKDQQDGRDRVEEKMVHKWRFIEKDIKIVEDEFDTHGRPKVKIIYVDMGDYPWEISMLDRCADIKKFLIEWEARQAAKLKYTAPRLIFVKQDRDFWPGSESDPECVRRCEVKRELLSDCSHGADYRQLYVHSWEDNKNHFLLFYNNPDMPGAQFIEENRHPLDIFEGDPRDLMSQDNCKCGGPDHVCLEYRYL